MRLAEDLTDPAKDPVYDAIGMVPTRRSIDFHWYLHGLNMYLVRAPGHHVRDMLAARPAAVFIPSYRTDWLPPEDHDFIQHRYVPLADDFWVLGTVLPAGGGTFDIVHAGRYRIASLQYSDIAGTGPECPAGRSAQEEEGLFTGLLDGMPLPSRPVELSMGRHRIEAARDCQPTVVWIGPRIDRVHRLSNGMHQTLFVNWY
jgi:hypothetical protein